MADTTQHVPVGLGACAGARLVLGCPAAPGAARGQGAARGSGQGGRTAAKVRAPAIREPVGWGVEATRRVAATLDWALGHVSGLDAACKAYCLAAPHIHDPLRNSRVARKNLLDLADIEVMLCFFKNYRKLRERFGDGPLPPNACPHGWIRRAPSA